MKKLYISIAALALFVTPTLAGTFPSTFDENCNINWIGGGCGDKPGNGSDDQPADVKEVVQTPTPPDDPPDDEPKDCEYKETYAK